MPGLSLARARVLVVLLAALTTVPVLGLNDLWHSDEPRYAQVAREIVRDGDWIVMHLNQEPYTEKPPLYFWCSALVGTLFGDVGPFSARFPSALAGAFGVLLCFEFGRRLYGEDRGSRVGFVGALLLATAAQWSWVSHRCAIDVLLATCVLGALLLEEIGRARLAAGDARGSWWRVAAFAAAGAGFLAKGPPVLIFFLIAIAARAWAERDWRSLARVPWLRGLLAFVVIVAAWGAPWAMRLGADEVNAILFRNTAGRMSESYAHAEHWTYYLGRVTAGMMPCTFAWLPIAWLAWKRRGARTAADAGTALSTGSRFLLAWSLVCLVFFSCISGKRTLYLMPIFPALALLTAAALDRESRAGRDLLAVVRRLAVIAAPLICVGVMLWLPLADRGFTFGRTFHASSPRPLGERVRRELDAGHVVALVTLRHPESALYFSGARHLEIFDLPAHPEASPDHPDVLRLRKLAELHGDRFVFVTPAATGERDAALLSKGAEKIDELVSDRRAYSLWKAR